MNKIYKLVFNRRIGAFVAVSEAAKSVAKGAVVVGTVSLGVLLLPDGALVRRADGQIVSPEAPCTAGSGGSMYGGTAPCVNYVNNTRVIVNSVSTSTSTAVSSLSTGVSSLSTSVSSLSTGVSSMSTAVSSMSTAVSSMSTGVSSLSTSTSTTVQPIDGC